MAAIVAGAMVFAMAGCSGGTDSSSETPADGGETEQTAEGGEEKGDKLIMATNATFPPYEYYENNQIVGIDAEIGIHSFINEELDCTDVNSLVLRS